jgi:hypothetical protein
MLPRGAGVIAAVSLVAISVAASAQTRPPWNPGALPPADQWNAYFENKQDLIPAGGPSLYGLDGSPQMGVGNSPGATEYPMIMGGQTGTGGSISCVHGYPSIDPTVDVNCHFTAENNGSVYLNNGWGHLAKFLSPGGFQTSPLLFTAADGLQPGDISSGTAGVSPTIGGNTPITTSNLGALNAQNANPDFWFDHVHNGTLVTAQTSGEVVDAWRVISINVSTPITGKLSFQRVAVTVTGYVLGEQINALAGAYSPAAADAFDFTTYMTGGEAAPFQLGNFNAQSINYQICLNPSSGITLPFIQPVYWNNNNAGGTFRSYVTTVTITNLEWQCFKLTLPADSTAGLWNSVSHPDEPALVNGIDLGSGSNFQTANLNVWQNGDFRTTAGAGQLVDQAAGAYIQVTGVHNRVGSLLTAPYQPLPYIQELAKAQNHFYSTFPIGTTPIAGAGINLGEIQFAAQVSGANPNFFSLALPFTPNNAAAGNGTNTFLSPAAASSSHVRDETAGADGGTCSVLSWKANVVTGTCVGASSTAAGNILGINDLIDTGM